jgi:hypothetical protein
MTHTRKYSTSLRGLLVAGVAAVGLGCISTSSASAAGPVYFCNTADAATTYRELSPNEDCTISIRSLTSVNAYAPYSTVQGICAAPTWSNGSSAGIDCGYGTTGGSVSFGGAVTAYPRIKALSSNTARAQFRGRYWY